MNLRPAGVVLLAIIVAGCGSNGAPQYAGTASDPVAEFGQCAICHSPMANHMAPTAPDLKCQVCHADQAPGMVGPGHRAIPGATLVPSFPGPEHLLHAEAPFGSCAFCHNQFGMNLAPTRGGLLCPVCHDDQRPGAYGPGHRSIPGPQRVPSFPNPMHQLGAEAVFTPCALCHNEMAINLLPVSQDLTCGVCHDDLSPGNYGPGHRSLPGPDRVPSAFPDPAHTTDGESAFGACAYCHNEFAANMVPVSNELLCVNCHADQQPGVYGPGHRSIPGPAQVPSFAGPQHQVDAQQQAFGSCAFCHNEFAANMEAVGSDLQCPVCHADQQPGVFGPGHRSIPGPDQVPSFAGPQHQVDAQQQAFGSCAFCHNEFAANMQAVGSELQCPVCHADQQPGVYGPGHRRIPGPDQVPSFAGPQHQVDTQQQAFGSCAFCHNEFAANMEAVGSALQCPVCHADQQPGVYGPGHRSIPGPEQVPSFAGPQHSVGEQQQAFGECAYCHNQTAVNLGPVGNDLQCPVCHADQQPGMFGPGHRAIPGPEQVPSFPGPQHSLGAQQVFGYCAFCHNEMAVNMGPVGNDLQCTVCHADQQPGNFGPGHRMLPGPDLVPSFPGPAHSLGPQAGFGFCAFCHDEKAVNMTASGVSVNCTFCHTEASPDFGPGHRNLPGPEQVQSFPGPEHLLGPEKAFGQCGFCHNELTVTALMSTHGSLTLECAQCHGEALPGEYGPGHETVPRCADCHTKQHTHEDPAVGTVRECTNCHTPHGSTNIYLINEVISPPGGEPRGVVFNNILGLADGSFASVTHPGTGLCETCHTSTQFYRSDGTGAPHFPYPCFTCHPHAGGFAPD
jgi:predicted CXXCH cytochrome family protein